MSGPVNEYFVSYHYGWHVPSSSLLSWLSLTLSVCKLKTTEVRTDAVRNYERSQANFVTMCGVCRATYRRKLAIILAHITLTNSNGNRSWNIRLILAPLESSNVLTVGPDPSMVWSKSLANNVTILQLRETVSASTSSARLYIP